MHWLRNRRKQYDDIEAMCEQARKESEDVEELRQRLMRVIQDGWCHNVGVRADVVEPVGTDKIRVHLTRPGSQKGVDVVVLTLGEEE